MLTDPRLMLLSPGDSVYVLRDQIAASEAVMVNGVAVAFPQALGLGHKIARVLVAKGDQVIKYGAPIGRASRAIAPGVIFSPVMAKPAISHGRFLRVISKNWPDPPG